MCVTVEKFGSSSDLLHVKIGENTEQDESLLLDETFVALLGFLLLGFLLRLLRLYLDFTWSWRQPILEPATGSFLLSCQPILFQPDDQLLVLHTQ